MKTIADYPAYRIIEATPGRRGLPVFKDRDTFAVDSGRGYWNIYSLGSVASYALEYGECPIQSVAKAKQNGHKLWWANPVPACLTSHQQAQEIHRGLKIGDRIEFQGRIFTIQAAANHNVDLAEEGLIDHQIYL